MEAKFWYSMWESGNVGFHQQQMNRFMTEHWRKLQLKGKGAVLVPLCGKSMDMLWLAKQGHTIIGVELSQKALDEFLIENGITAAPVEHDQYCGYALEGMTLLCGDFFKLSAQDCQAVMAVYDRAAIVALPIEMRARYVSHLKAILPKETVFFMVTMDYDQRLMSGPPFSVSEQEVRDLFADYASVEKIHQVTFSRKGVETTEMVFVIRP